MHQKTKILEGFSFSISPSREYSGSLSLKIDWSDLAVEGTLGVFSSATVRRHQFLVLCRYSPALTIVHDHWEDHSLDYTDLCRQSNVSAFQHSSRFVIAFLPRSNCLLISWLQSPICSDFGDQEEELCHYFHLFPFYLPCSNGVRCHDLSSFNI